MLSVLLGRVHRRRLLRRLEERWYVQYLHELIQNFSNQLFANTLPYVLAGGLVDYGLDADHAVELVRKALGL